MATYRHIVRLPFTSGVPEDATVNVFHSECADFGEAQGFADALVTFYNAIDGTFSNQLASASNSATVSTYDLADPEPRVPFDVQAFTVTPGISGMPMETALCLSFQGIKISGQPQARRRGRVYLGPFANAAAGTDGRPATATITTVVNAATTLLAAYAVGVVGKWAVYSPTDNQAVVVADGWVDNEWDTVRSRGRKATARTTFT